MFYVCAVRFDVIGNLVIFWFLGVSKQDLKLF